MTDLPVIESKTPPASGRSGMLEEVCPLPLADLPGGQEIDGAPAPGLLAAGAPGGFLARPDGTRRAVAGQPGSCAQDLQVWPRVARARALPEGDRLRLVSMQPVPPPEDLHPGSE
jgi:hypothetical protein